MKLTTSTITVRECKSNRFGHCVIVSDDAEIECFAVGPLGWFPASEDEVSLFEYRGTSFVQPLGYEQEMNDLERLASANNA